MMRPQLAAAALAATLGALPCAAWAQCDFRAPHRQEFRNSGMVVIGQVSATARHADTGFNDYTVKVERQLKGKSVPSLVIRSENTARGFQMKEQRSYLLFVSQRPDKTWFVDNCGNSAPMAHK